MNTGSDDTWHCPKCFANIKPRMNPNERGLLQGTIEGGVAPQIPFASLCDKRKTSPERRATLILRKNYTYILAVGLRFRSHFETQSRLTSRVGEGCFVY
jgi:hypothetical protein